LVGW
jgi:hypothetical protein